MEQGIWVHEKMVCKMANISRIEGKSARDVLSDAIMYLKKGYFGRQRDKKNIDLGAVDLHDQNNSLSLFYQSYGSHEEFSTAGSFKAKSSTLNIPRYFFYGNGSAQIRDLSTQITIANRAMG